MIIWPMYLSPYTAAVHWPFPSLQPFGQCISPPMRPQYIGRFLHFGHLANVFLSLCDRCTLAVTAITTVWPMYSTSYMASVHWPSPSLQSFGQCNSHYMRLLHIGRCCHFGYLANVFLPLCGSCTLAVCHDMPLWPMIRPKTTGDYPGHRI